jgi:prepilin-type processing-associated H-X9-DG protein
VTYDRDGDRKLTVDEVRKLGEIDDGYTPLLWSCTNNDPQGLGYQMKSHDYQGVNGAFVDGSVRWIERAELSLIASLNGMAQPDGRRVIMNNKLDGPSGTTSMFEVVYRGLTISGR